MFAVLIRLYPRHPETEGRLVMSGPWSTEAEAQAHIDEARRQNLPYKGKWIVAFEDPTKCQP